MRVFDLAKQLGLKPLDLVDKIKALDIDVKNHMSSVTEEQVQLIVSKFKGSAKEEAPQAAAAKASQAKPKKRVVKKKAASSSKEEAPAKKVKKARVVLRSKKEMEAVKKGEASDPAEAAAAAAAPSSQSKAAASSSSSKQAASKETQTFTPGKTPTAFKARTLGKIALKDNFKKPSSSRPGSPRPGSPRPGSPRPGSSSRPPRPSSGGPSFQQRGDNRVRSGFVPGAYAPKPFEDFAPTERAAPSKPRVEKKKRSPAVNNEEPPQFSASDFRKREALFQTKRDRHFVGEGKKNKITTPSEHKRVVLVHKNLSTAELADALKVKPAALLKKLLANGVEANMTTSLDFETIALMAPEFGYEAKNNYRSLDDLLKEAVHGDMEEEPSSRPPVVTIMGHVDHGKTSLLDALRQTNVVSSESGGITQHIGAYSIEVDKKSVTFIDTPGHAAFTQMRARGANITDVVILVVAANDGVMPQTIEALNHAKSANVPIVVAVNKMDLPDVNPEKVKKQLAEHNLIPEDWGGDTLYVSISALKKEGFSELLEKIFLTAELMELKAPRSRSASGVVVESSLGKNSGITATLLVREGTLKVGDIFVAGMTMGKVRALRDDKNRSLKSVEPGFAVEVLGFSQAPSAGDFFYVCQKEAQAKEIIELQKESASEGEPVMKMEKEKLLEKMSSMKKKSLPLLLKADVSGSLEAIRAVLLGLNTDEVEVNIVHAGVGAINESDVLLGSATKGSIMGFNVRPTVESQNAAKSKQVSIHTHNVIYELKDAVKKMLEGLLDPSLSEESLGRAEIRNVFNISKVGQIAGCLVKSGKVKRGAQVRLLREGRIVYEGVLSSLKRMKNDVQEVKEGYECGIGIENYNDIKVGDELEFFAMVKEAKSL